MKFIKKISVFTVALILMLSVVTLLTNGSLNVKASEETVGGVTKTYQTTVINSNAEELGIPESLDFNFNYKDENLTFPYTLNGFKYSRPSGTLTAELCEDAATIETIGITDQVPSQYVYASLPRRAPAVERTSRRTYLASRGSNLTISSPAKVLNTPSAHFSKFTPSTLADITYSTGKTASISPCTLPTVSGVEGRGVSATA